MRAHLLSGLLLAGAAFSTLCEAAGQPPALQPLSTWNLDYGETQCLASRKYGDAADPVTFAIRQSPNGDSYELLVGRKRRVTLPIIEEEGIVDFGRGPINAWVLFYQTPDKALDVHQFRISAA